MTSFGFNPVYQRLLDLPSKTVPTNFDSILVLSYDEPGDGGGAIWIRVPSEPPHGAKVQDNAGAWWELSSNQILNPKMIGAKGDADAAGNSPSGADDTGPIDTLLSLVDEVYLPRGYYRVSKLMGGSFPIGKHLSGPGIAVPFAEFNTDYYGDTLVAGTKIGNRIPVSPHGGFLIGGSGPTPEGTILRASNEGVNEFMPTRFGQPMQLQLYSNALQGNGILNGTLFTIMGKQDLIFVNDVIWLGSARYRVASVEIVQVGGVFETRLGIAVFDNTPLPTDSTLRFWIAYQHAEYTGYYDANGDFTRESGDPVEKWIASYDHNVIYHNPTSGDHRFEAAVDGDTLDIHITNGPAGPIEDMKIIHRWATGEDYVVLFRLQGGAFEKEIIVAHYIRPDFAAMRIGATGQGGDDYVDYPDYHILGERVAGEPNYSGETNQTGEGYTYLTFRNGHVGIHERDPKVALHVSRHFNSAPEVDGVVEQELATFKAVFGAAFDQGKREDAESLGRRLSVVVRNNYRAPGLQGFSPGVGAQAICIQPNDEAQSKCHFGSWDAVPDPYRFQFTGGVRIVSGIQVEAVSVTAAPETPSPAIGPIPGGTARVLISSDNENKVASLPAAAIGHIIRLYVGSTGCELRSVVESDQANGTYAIGSTHELKLDAESHYSCEYVAQNRWVVRGFTSSGAAMPPLVPHLR